MNKHNAAPAPVTPLFAPVCLLPRFSRFVVQPTPDGQHVITDTLFGLHHATLYPTAQAAETVAQSWRARAKYPEVA